MPHTNQLIKRLYTMQTSTMTFEKFTRTSKPTLATDSTRQCKKSIKLARKLARKNKRFDYEGDL